MELTWPLLTVAGLVLTGVVLALGLLPRGRRLGGGHLLVAHAARLRRLPRFRQLARRQAWVRAVQSAALLLMAVGSALLAGRPVEVDTVPPEARSRDIMLCLDVSASMDPYNVEVIEEVRRVTEELQGERIGLSIWNATAIGVFPLTDDYTFIQEELDRSVEAIESYDFAFFAGTFNEEERSSLIGDGLVSCAQRFDRPEDERGRAMVVASDNDPQGEPIYPLDEAADYLRERDIVLYAIGVPLMQPALEQALSQAAESTGGQMYLLGEDDGGAAGIVEGIQALEQERLEAPSEPVVTERPGPGAAVAGAGLALLVLTALPSVSGRRTRGPGGGR